MPGCAAFLLLLSLQLRSQDMPGKIVQLLERYHSYDALNGSVLVADGDKIICKAAFGKANFEWGIDNTTDTKYEIASLTKTFTAVIILQLAESGKLKLDGKVSEYLPSFPKGDKITLEQLLLHTSGITDTRFLDGFDTKNGMQQQSRDELIAVFRDRDLLFEPGTKWSYSNFNYNLLAYIAEKVSGMSFDQLLKEKIFQPA